MHTFANYGLNEYGDCWEAVFRYSEDNIRYSFTINSEAALETLLHNLLSIIR